jgi:hypothetical protein
MTTQSDVAAEWGTKLTASVMRASPEALPDGAAITTRATALAALVFQIAESAVKTVYRRDDEEAPVPIPYDEQRQMADVILAEYEKGLQADLDIATAAEALMPSSSSSST